MLAEFLVRNVEENEREQEIEHETHVVIEFIDETKRISVINETRE